MPKVDFFLNPGDQPPAKLAEPLRQAFSEKTLEKLLKFGGRVRISITAPFIDRKKQNSKLIIDSVFIEELRKNFKKAEDILNKLTKKQLIEVAKAVGYPFDSKAITKEIRNGIIAFLGSPEKWSKISGVGEKNTLSNNRS